MRAEGGELLETNVAIRHSRRGNKGVSPFRVVDLPTRLCVPLIVRLSFIEQVSENVETFRKYRTLLGATVSSYNNIRKTTRRVEYRLIEKEITRIDLLVSRGETELCWKSDGVLEYIAELGELVEGLWRRMKSTQTNVEKMKAALDAWTRTPLIERKDRRKDGLLSFEERPEKVSRRYGEVERAAEQIHSLLEENRLLFQVSDEMEEPWQRYVAYVDGIVMESLRRAVGCSLGEWFLDTVPRQTGILFP